MIDLTSPEKGCKWYFAPGVNYNVGPTDAAGQNFAGSWDSLIRETIQNSLDAVRDPSQPVVVRLSFRSMPMRNYMNFFGLRDHVKSCLDTFPDTARAKYGPMQEMFGHIMSEHNARMPYLQVSDYNTKGMAYDENNDSCNFSAFVRGLGVHGGDQNATGRGGAFGLGKSTIYTMSPIRTMMVSTYTSNGQYVFEGVASLTTHKMDDERYSHIGYYDNCDGHPITKAQYIPERFVRKADDGGVPRSGTDIFIMGRELEDGDLEDIKRQVLTHYWLSIYKGKLIVELAQTNELVDIINEVNLQEMMEATFNSMVDNARNSLNPRPYYEAVVNDKTAPGCKYITKELPQLGSVELYLMKNKDAQNDRLAFFRLPCMMVMRKSTSQLILRINNYGVYGAFVCLNDKGDKLLKQLENPAHNEWNEKNWRSPHNNRIEQKATQVMTELREFLASEIEEFCKTRGQASLKMIGAGKYLYTVQDVVENENDDVRRPEGGYVAGTNFVADETGSIATKSPEDMITNVPDVPVGLRPGNVTNLQGGATADSSDDKPNKLEVKVKTPTKKKNKTNKKNVDGDITKTATASDKPAAVIIPIEFKVYASKEAGRYVHNICISTEQDVESALVQFSAKREDGKIDKELEIVDSFGAGSCNGMELRNVVLKKGDNMLKVRFNDNMKHALNINVKS